MPEKQDLGPATPGLAHERQKDAVEVVRDVLAGTLHLRAKGKKYLPKFPKEKEAAYEARRKVAVLFNALKRTRDAYSGMIFRKPPTVSDDVPDEIQGHLENVDLAGRDAATFLKDHFEDAESDGHACIFVDMQPPTDADSLAEERDAGLRPYWINLRKQDILAFETTNVAGVTVLTELRFRETVTRKEGQWREVEVHRVREYFLAEVSEDGADSEVRAVFRVWELDPEKEWPGEGEEDWRVVDGFGAGGERNGVMAVAGIPLAVTYTGRTGVLESDPPLLDLALENLKHFQTDSDNQNLARTAKVQTLVFTGVSEEDVKSVAVGPGNALVLENSEANAQWIGADGSNFQVFLDDLQRIELRMAVLGASQLMSESRAAETAASKRIDKAEGDSQLAANAKNLQSASAEALRWHNEWLRETRPGWSAETGGTLGINTDFETEPLDSAVFKEFRELWAARGLSWRTLMQILDKGEVMPEGFDVDEERKRIAEEAGEMLDAVEGALFEGEEEEEDEPTEEAA